MRRMPDHDPQPDAGSELASFGEELRREREIRGISLKEIADATKISKRFLEAIERNDHKTLPAPMFTRGFVREYARYVGLNAEDMVNRYNFAAAKDDRIEKPPHVEKYAVTPPRDISPKPAPKRGIPSPFARVDRNAVILVAILIALAGVAYWAVRHRRASESEAETTPPIAVTATKAAAPVPALAPPETSDPSKLHMTLEVTANSWVTLEADGKTVVNTEMSQGERKTFDAAEEFRFRTIGNAAGVALTINGVTIPPLGEDGEVVKNRTFDRETLEKIRGSAQPNPS